MLPNLPLTIYLVVALALAVFGAHMGLLLWLGRGRWHGPARVAPTEARPRVTVQLPLYNERFVAERGIRAMAALRWPRDRLQIQVLDDSTDESAAMVRDVVAELAAAGHDIVLLHRTRRRGFKAGALAEALPSATGEFVAIFDADFVPAPDFLEALLVERSPFANSRVGFVQARWSYLNREQNLLTRAQAVMHDPHFFLEQPMRSEHGWAFNFNGSGGLWRRAAIDDAGGWKADTLTEDLDLSYRAFLKGWRGVYVGDVTAPNDLPEDIFSFKRQQTRWARGSMQCAKKLIVRCWRSPEFDFKARFFATVHLLGYALHPCLLAFVVLWPLCQLLPIWVAGAREIPLWIVITAPFGLMYPIAMVRVQFVQGRPGRRIRKEFLTALWLGVGLGINNTAAVLQGIFRREPGEFLRTPKPAQGAVGAGGYRVRANWTLLAEALVCVTLCAAAVVMWRQHFLVWAITPLFYASGYAAIVVMQVNDLWSRRTAPRESVAPSLSRMAPVAEE